MITNILNIWRTLTDWLPVLTGLVLMAEAEATAPGAGADKKAKVIDELTDNLAEKHPWVLQDWADSFFGYMIDLLVGALNKYGKDLMKTLAKFIPKESNS
mgnify:CR=1 FL=1